MKTIEFANKYGCLHIQVGEYVPVSSIKSKDVPEDYRFGVSVAEWVALITENKGIQLSVISGSREMFLTHHKSSGVAAVAKITVLIMSTEFNPTDELSRPNIYGRLIG